MHKPLENLPDLAHTMDERYLLSYLSPHHVAHPTSDKLLPS